MGSTKQKPPLVAGRCSICCKPTFNYLFSIAGVTGVNHLSPKILVTKVEDTIKVENVTTLSVNGVRFTGN